MTLEQKIRDVLARLSTLSEANASNLEPRTSHGKSSSRAPAGVSEKGRLQPTDSDQPPPKERSLFDWYTWQFNRVWGDFEEMLKFYLLAERDYHTRSLNLDPDRHINPTLAARRRAVRSGSHLDADEKPDTEDGDAPAWPAPLPVNHDSGGAEDEVQAAKQVVDLYEGHTAEEAAVFEGTTVQVIHKARKMHQRNTDDGRPRPPFRDWSDDERQRQVNLLIAQAKHRDEILGAKAIAKHFGVDKNTVKRYLEPVGVAA